MSSTEISVSWAASTDDVGVTGYTIYRDLAQLATVAGTTLSYADTSVQPNTTYSYTVDAFDAAGNHSPQSDPASATAPSPFLFADDFESGDLSKWTSVTGLLVQQQEVTATSTASSTAVSSGSWHEAQVHALINGTAGQSEVWLDGTPITALSKIYDLGTTPIGCIQLGENSTGRTYDIAFDDVVADTRFIAT